VLFIWLTKPPKADLPVRTHGQVLFLLYDTEQMTTTLIFSILILIFSAVLHELAHGYAALWLGDPTAKYQGRLTLNPISHLDPIGSVVVPLLLILSHSGFVVGWAKPVPYNPYNLRNQRWGEAIVAGAGPLTNILIALIFGLILRFGAASGLSDAYVQILVIIVLTNLSLAVFNLVPVPPLDGSKILFSIFPNSLIPLRRFLERYALILALVLVVFLWQFISPLVYWAFALITNIKV
jgi:Zn-dependent protease